VVNVEVMFYCVLMVVICRYCVDAAALL